MAFSCSGSGRRKFATLETAGGLGADDLLAGRIGTARIFGWLRSERSNPTRNLILKEIRLLWPVWTITLIAVLFLLLLAPFRIRRGGNHRSSPELFEIHCTDDRHVRHAARASSGRKSVHG